MPEYIDAPDLPDAVRIKALRDLHETLRTPHPSLVENKPKGGTMLSFVGHAAVTEMLLRHDPLWSWVPYAISPLSGEPLMDRDANGRPIGMWIKLTIFDHSRVGYGSVEANDRKQDGDLIKEIIGDGIRNAAMRFGVALNLWSKNDLEAAAPEASPADNVLTQAKGWSKSKRDKIKQVLTIRGIIDDTATTFELFAEQVGRHPDVAQDIEAWVKAQAKPAEDNNEAKIIKDLEEIATDE
ncbi:hypothetical protein UFOVP929_4 [uncultured Caudovirales phage]|uniref:Uncharacterized protein n=1 Tax=uncultured Caudovirales phage TaxID=2100421 RepID=A0A6J5PJA9_9CAUD|nr:hypothetical protein UFOVP929_4 [uncultured Caudovirales phage]